MLDKLVLQVQELNWREYPGKNKDGHLWKQGEKIILGVTSYFSSKLELANTKNKNLTQVYKCVYSFQGEIIAAYKKISNSEEGLVIVNAGELMFLIRIDPLEGNIMQFKKGQMITGRIVLGAIYSKNEYPITSTILEIKKITEGEFEKIREQMSIPEFEIESSGTTMITINNITQEVKRLPKIDTTYLKKTEE
ncbi:hypothetical protein HUU53_00135 [Candidatus Micrarchaeota archaeon]|nr:hypothetical protein [Candidatus Micrarchaeota archaeon]